MDTKRIQSESRELPAGSRRYRTRGILRKRDRGRLPHWEMSGAACFVTFRLYDSVPTAIADAYRFERENILKTAEQLTRPLSETEQERLFILYSDKIERYLDSGSGHCFLKHPGVAQLVQDSLKYFHNIRYRLYAHTIMPNHVHVVFELFEGYLLEHVLHSWKSYTATKANKLLKRSGQFWQKEYYDHLIRNEIEFKRIIKYVLDNPQKANLKDWPWVKLYSD